MSTVWTVVKEYHNYEEAEFFVHKTFSTQEVAQAYADAYNALVGDDPQPQFKAYVYENTLRDEFESLHVVYSFGVLRNAESAPGTRKVIRHIITLPFVDADVNFGGFTKLRQDTLHATVAQEGRVVAYEDNYAKVLFSSDPDALQEISVNSEQILWFR